MEQCKIDFSSITWEIPADGVRFKSYKQNGKQVNSMRIKSVAQLAAKSFFEQG